MHYCFLTKKASIISFVETSSAPVVGTLWVVEEDPVHRLGFGGDRGLKYDGPERGNDEDPPRAPKGGLRGRCLPATMVSSIAKRLSLNIDPCTRTYDRGICHRFCDAVERVE